MVTTRRRSYNSAPRAPRRRRAPRAAPPVAAVPAPVVPPAPAVPPRPAPAPVVGNVGNSRHRPRDNEPYVERVVTHTRRKRRS